MKKNDFKVQIGHVIVQSTTGEDGPGSYSSEVAIEDFIKQNLNCSILLSDCHDFPRDGKLSTSVDHNGVDCIHEFKYVGGPKDCEWIQKQRELSQESSLKM